MFSEYLKSHPLADLRPYCPFPKAADRMAWNDLPTDKRDELRTLAARYRNMAYPILTATQYMAFAREGNRSVWEKPYFERRRKLTAALLGFCVDENRVDLDALIDGIWLICEESAWVVSAHNGGEHAGMEPTPPAPLPDADRPYVDLFSAQTAMIMSLACDLAGEALDNVSPLVRRRVKNEVERRVLVPFETRDDFWWMGFIRKDLCNWTPWIVSNVFLTACAWVDDNARLYALLARGCAMLDCYLAILPADGGCDEGPGYWSMAGGALLDCLELLERVTEGQMTFWDDEKLRGILSFPLNMWLGDGWFVNYADCDAKPAIPGERLRFAGKRMGEGGLVALGSRFDGPLSAEIEDTPQLWRLLDRLFHPVETCIEAAPPADVWLPDLEVRIVRAGGMTLVCKGGVNEGSHNHNDCGSFMVYVDGEPVIVDAGNMTYTGKTFSNERYTLWNTRSAYHNVPMFGGCEQVNGWERRATDVRALPDGLSMDISAAYPEAAGVLSCRREAVCEENGCRITDSIQTQMPVGVTEVFLLRHQPVIENGTVVSEGIRIAPNTSMDIVVEEIPIDDPRMAKSFPGSLWRVCFTTHPSTEHVLQFAIKRKEYESIR